MCVNLGSGLAIYRLDMPGDGEYCPWFSGAFYLIDLHTHTHTESKTRNYGGDYCSGLSRITLCGHIISTI